MKSLLTAITICALAVSTLTTAAAQHTESVPDFYIETDHAGPVAIGLPGYVGRVKLNSRITIRLIILKHCRERIADEESDGVIKAANLAASEGLSITDLGQHHVNQDGPLKWGKAMTLEGLKKFISAQMKVSAKTGDTLIIYTTGHGGQSGGLQILGEREPVARIIAQAAVENNQETLWWQSSCYASAGLPSISSFTPEEQKLFSMIASSVASKPSYWHDQTEPMKKLFFAIAQGSKEIDPNEDGTVSAKELADFMEKVKPGAGRLVFACSDDEPIFGWFDIINSLPIFNPEGQQQQLPEDYIPTP